MSKIVSQNTEPVVVHQIGNLSVTASEPDDGGVMLLKVATLIVGGMATIGVSPIIGASLWGYAVLKITGLVSSVDGSSGLGQQLRDDLQGRPSNIPADAPRYLPSENTRLGAIEVPSFTIPVTSSESKLFDWSNLNTVYDDFPHLLLLGKTGAGKSFLAEKLGRFLDGATIVITPKKKPKDFAGMQVIGVPYDFAAIAENIAGLSKIVRDREAEMNRTGDDSFGPINVILDEVPTFVAGCKDLNLDVVKDLKFIIRAGRTSRVRLILLAQGQEVKTLGIEGEGSLRDNLSYVYLKGFAEKQAADAGLDISKDDRPCIIDGKVADIAALVSAATCNSENAGLEPLNPQPSVPKPASTPQDLDRMFNLPSAEHEVEESGTEQQGTTAIGLKNAFPGWNEKSIEVACKVVEFLNKQPEKTFKAHQLKSSISAIKKTDVEKIRALLSKLGEGRFIQADGDDYSAIAPSIDDDFNW
ncbi:MAG: hypothetical protein KME13_23400 [Myxacorys californica WJT36-NPBG1]|jgi:hypothetical protein|nr:hypothetical protein [Myxacorys californica WJT36-NPBG1]